MDEQGSDKSHWKTVCWKAANFQHLKIKTYFYLLLLFPQIIWAVSDTPQWVPTWKHKKSWTTTHWCYKDKFFSQVWSQNREMHLECSSAVRCRQGLEADVQGADHSGLLLDGLLQFRLIHTHQGHQPLGKLPTEEQVDAGVCTAVQTCQKHQDGEGCSWKHWRENGKNVNINVNAYKCI